MDESGDRLYYFLSILYMALSNKTDKDKQLLIET